MDNAPQENARTPIPCYVSGKGMHATATTWAFKTLVIEALESSGLGYDTRYRYYRNQFPDLERAARFLYLQKTAFGGKVTGQTFGVTKDGGGRFNLTRLAPLLEEVHERMAGVVIECLAWAEFIDRWDRKGMLFYLDPPL